MKKVIVAVLVMLFWSGLVNAAEDDLKKNPMWRAAIDVINFMPLVTTDYAAGRIVTDWYKDVNNRNNSLKFTIIFLSNKIHPDSLKIIIHKKTCKTKTQSNCIIKKISSKLEDTIRSQIITLARAGEPERKKPKYDDKKIIIHKKTCKMQSNCIVQKISSKLEDTIRSQIMAKATALEAASKKKK